MKWYDTAKCLECGRLFDLANEDDASEWLYGHDCEEVTNDAGVS